MSVNVLAFPRIVPQAVRRRKVRNDFDLKHDNPLKNRHSRESGNPEGRGKRVSGLARCVLPVRP
jgi:hypothetical protein